MRVAYADPPYVGQAAKHYGCPEIDHAELIGQLELYDGWALSLSSPSLRDILPLCPDGVRVMAWVKPFASFKKGVNPAYAWEPVIVKPTRKLMYGSGHETERDWVSAGITLQRGTHGAKPAKFCYWLFRVLGLEPEDEFIDLFIGSGAVTEAWHTWQSQMEIPHFEQKGELNG